MVAMMEVMAVDVTMEIVADEATEVTPVGEQTLLVTQTLPRVAPTCRLMVTRMMMLSSYMIT